MHGLPSRHRRIILLVAVFVAAAGVSTAAVLERGVVVEVVDENASITLGQRFEFSTVTVYGDRIEVDGENITLRSNTSARLNATLWEYNLTNETDGQEIIRIGTEAVTGSNVTSRFTGIPPIGGGNYTLHRDGTHIATFESGGTVQWFETNWSKQNYSLVANHAAAEEDEEEDTGDDGGDGTGGGGDVFLPSEPDRPGLEPVTREIVVRLLPGESTDVTLRFRNNGSATGTYNASVENITGFVSPDERSTTLAANETAALPFLIRAAENVSVDVYTGEIRIAWNEGVRSIPVTVIVRSQEQEELLDVQMNVLNVDIGQVQSDVGYRVDIFNLGGTDRVDITLHTRVSDANGTVVLERSETLAVETSLSAVRSITHDLAPGQYTLEVEAVYANRKATSSSTFTVAREAEQDILPFILAGVLLLTALLAGGVYTHRRLTGPPAGITQCETCGEQFQSEKAFDVHRNRHRLESVTAAAEAAETAEIDDNLLRLSEDVLEHLHGPVVTTDAFQEALSAAETGAESEEWDVVEEALLTIKELLENHQAG